MEQVLVHRSMWLSAPSQFNDPWEGRFSLDFAGSESDKLATYRQMIAWEFGENVPEQVVDEQAKQWLNDQPDEATVRQAAKHAIENSRACLRILSLTEKPDDLLMWAYYADAHAGICFEFDTTAGDDSIFANALPVDYRDDFPVVEFYKQEAVIDKVRYVAFMKSTSWSHEKEWRVVKPSDDHPIGSDRQLSRGSASICDTRQRCAEGSRKDNSRLGCSLRSGSPTCEKKSGPVRARDRCPVSCETSPYSCSSSMAQSMISAASSSPFRSPLV